MMTNQNKQLAAQLFARLIAKAGGISGMDLPLNHPVNSFTEFKRVIYSRYSHAPHLQLLDEHLQLVSKYVESEGKEGIGRLIIAMPPRHGKTVTTSRLYPIWHLGRNPYHTLMLVSHTQSYANKNSRIARNYIRADNYQAIFPKTTLARDSRNVMEWNIESTEGDGAGYWWRIGW